MRWLVFVLLLAGKAAQAFSIGNGPVTDLAWTPDGRRLAYCGAPGCRIADPASGATLVTFPDTFALTAGNAGDMVFDPGGAFLLLPSEMHTVSGLLTIWNFATGAQIGALSLPEGLAPGSDTVGRMVLSANGRRLAASPVGANVIATYSFPALRLAGAFTPPGFLSSEPLAIAPDGATIAVPENNRAIVTHDPVTGARTGGVTYAFDFRVEYLSALAYSPDGKFLAAGFADGGSAMVPSLWPTQPILIWKLRDGVPAANPVKLCGSQPSGVANMVWRADGKGIVYADGDGRVAECAVTGEAATTILDEKTSGQPYLALSPDGRKLAIGVNDDITVVTVR